ncbi:MAG: FxSxx-COOH system tetratricopeptide repeat protein, partial [Actinomycetes bacterium]
EALTAYEACRRSLDSELGLLPSSALRSTHEAVLRQERALDWQPTATTATPRLLPPRNRQFGGRDADLYALDRLLHDEPVVAVFGLAGCGKSALALELAHRRPGLAWWVPAEDTASATTALVELAARLNLDSAAEEAEVLGQLWDALARRDDWLLVFDNAEGAESLRHLLPPTVNGRVVITSQNPAWSGLGATVRVLPFARGSAVRFLLARANRREPEAAAELAGLLGDLPLALEQAGAYIDQTGISVAEYLRLFRSRHDQLLQRGAPPDHRATVAATWQLVFDRVRSRSRLAGQVLELSAFLSPDGIPLTLFDPLVESGVGDLGFVEDVAELLRYSLVDRAGDRLSIHRLVQTVVRGQLPPDVRRERAEAAVDLVARAAPAEPSVPDAWPAWSMLAPQIQALLRSVRTVDPVPTALLRLSVTCARYYRARGSLRSAHTLLDSAIEAAEAAPARTTVLAELYAERGDVLDGQGGLAAAQAELERAVATFHSLPGQDDLAEARTWARLAHILNCADAPGDSVAYYGRALAVLRTRAQPAEVIRALIGFGYAQWGLDDFAAGEACFTEALSLLDELGWDTHPFRAEALGGRGMMLHEQGRLTAARDLQLQALEVLDRLYGATDHATIAETHDKLCYVGGLRGEWAEARAHGELAAAMLARLFGEDDPRLAMALTNLGLAHAALGDVVLAHATQSRALGILSRAYGADHRNTRLVAARLASLSTDGPGRPAEAAGQARSMT